jgi:hypothetical protein
MAAIDDLIKQIQSRSNTSQWTGGYGADAATKDMARILSSIGITNIKDFGKIDKYEPIEQIGSTLNGQPVEASGSKFYVTDSLDTGDGTDYVRRELSPEEAQQVKPTYGIATGTDEYNQPTYRTVEATNVAVKDGQLVGVTGQTFGNKLTGQEVPNTYTTRQTGDFFGGTYEGKGNTGYGVQFDAQGLPVFYTQGASSKDDIITDLMPMVQLALMATGAGGLLGNTLLGAGANQVAAGALGGALLGGGTAAIAGQDVLKGALLGGAGGALSGYLNPATGQVSAVPTEGSIPVSGDDIAKLTGASTDLGIDYSLSNSTAMRPLTDMGGAQGLRAGTAANLAEMGGAQGLTFNVGAPVTSIADAVKAIATMNGSVNPANLAEMGGGQGLTYQTPTGLVTQDAILNVGGLTGNNSVIGAKGIDTATNIGSDIAKRVAAIDTGVDRMKLPATPVDAKTAAKTGLSASDVIRAASVAATIAGLNQASKSTGSPSGFPIVPIPSDWTSPIKPTGTAAFTPLAPIDFGNKEMLRGTQWEQLLSPDYGKAPAMPTSTNPSNMTFNELTRILGGSTTSAPSQNLSINDVIAGIQSQYGQTPTGSMG